MRKRINKAAICSSENYEASRKLHIETLINNHQSFSGMAVSRTANDYNGINFHRDSGNYVTVKVFGKPIRITKEEYNEHYAHLGFKPI